MQTLMSNEHVLSEFCKTKELKYQLLKVTNLMFRTTYLVSGPVCL